MTAELDPATTLGEAASQRGDNETFFRFAIKDGALTPLDVVTGFAASSVTAVDGNDFAQAPHAALKDYLDGVIKVGNAPMMQFGPYVPMDGRAVTSRKKPLDLVLLIDISGSMQTCINGLLKNIKTFVDQLMNGDANNEPIPDLRVKIVGYHTSYYASGDWFVDKGFTSDWNTLELNLSTLYATPWDESVFDALLYVAWEKDTGFVSCASPFRAKEEATRAVILFTDELPSGGYNFVAPGCTGKNLNNVIDDHSFKLSGK